MAREQVPTDTARPDAADRRTVLVRAGLDTLQFGFAIFDRDLKLVACNTAFRTLRGYPAALCRPGTEIVEFYRYNARARRLRRRRRRDARACRASTACGAASRTSSSTRRRPGRSCSVRYTPIVHDGLVLTYADITARKQAEAGWRAQGGASSQVALDNMPGALAYTDDELNIVVCNDRFAEMYPVPREAAAAGRPYPDVPALPRRARLLRRRRRRRAGRGARGKPAQSDRDRRSRTARPDGRIYEVYRRRAGAGGTVTVITDITELKQRRGASWRARRRSCTSRSTTCRARSPTRTTISNIVVLQRPLRRDVSGADASCSQPGRPYPAFLRYLAEHGYYGDGDVDALVARAWRACAIRPARRSRTARRTAASTGSAGAASASAER